MFYEDNHIKIYNKDCRFMSELPDESVQMVCTSPPYWGLRKYSGEQGLIWGDNHCEHQWVLEQTKVEGGHSGGKLTSGIMTPQAAERRDSGTSGKIERGFCSLCGAWKGAYGLEPTPEMYIEHTIEILREIRRVLRHDGCVFWNIGDSYYGSGGDHKEGGKNDAGFQGNLMRGVQAKQQSHNLLKPKDLCLIPFRVAIAAQEDGWWVRSVIIWSKPNPMPESVTDRPTESHEYILMLTKNKNYYWDADAVREPHTRLWDESNAGSMAHPVPTELHGVTGYAHSGKYPLPNPAGRNIRSVWEFPTQPFPAAHFAVFPEKLPEICIKAATPEVGCCSKCGAPWERILDREDKRHWTERNDYTGGKYPLGQSIRNDGRADFAVPQFIERGWQPTCKCNELKYESKYQEDSIGLTPQGFHRTASIERERRQSRIDARRLFPNDPKAQKEYIQKIHDHGGIKKTSTIGQQPTCQCNADKVPSIVLDPFAGAGTTLWVAKKLNRRAVGYEISEEYCQLAVDRSRQQVLL